MDPQSMDEWCRTRGIRLTTTRREVLLIMHARPGPISAYELIRALSESRKRKVFPPTVYRALDALRDLGLIARIESRNTFLARESPADHDSSLIYLCTQCGSAQEVLDPKLGLRVAADATRIHFHVAREVHEVEGVCGDCAAAAGVRASV
jgi:Fur family zinc uptake transcriptional regulator